jgi:hypothetical protein
MTGILITIEGICHSWVIDGPDEEKYGCLRVTFIQMPNKDLWLYLNRGKLMLLSRVLGLLSSLKKNELSVRLYVPLQHR